MSVDFLTGNTSRYYTVPDSSDFTLPDSDWAWVVSGVSTNTSGSHFCVSTGSLGSSYNLYFSDGGIPTSSYKGLVAQNVNAPVFINEPFILCGRRINGLMDVAHVHIGESTIHKKGAINLAGTTSDAGAVRIGDNSFGGNFFNGQITYVALVKNGFISDDDLIAMANGASLLSMSFAPKIAEIFHLRSSITSVTTGLINGHVASRVGTGYGTDTTDLSSVYTGDVYLLNATAASGDTNISLTGQGLSFSQGLVAGSIDVGLIGQELNVGQGLLGSGVDVGLIGQGLSVGQGLLSGNVDIGLIGQGLSVGQGLLGSGVDVGLIGQGLNVGQGLLSGNVDVGLIGQGLSVGQGFVTVPGVVNVTLDGQSLSVGQGLLFGGADVTLDGQSLSVGQGFVVGEVPAPGVFNITLTGQTLGVVQGILAGGVYVGLTGQGLSVDQGSVFGSLDVGLTGQGLNIDQGLLGNSLDVVLTGLDLGVDQGVVVGEVPAPGVINVTLAGLDLSLGQGVVSLSGISNVALLGLDLGLGQGSVVGFVSGASLPSVVDIIVGLAVTNIEVSG